MAIYTRQLRSMVWKLRILFLACSHQLRHIQDMRMN